MRIKVLMQKIDHICIFISSWTFFDD